MEEVKVFCKSNKVKIMMLCETKVPIPPSEGCVRYCGFIHFDFLPSKGLAGGMWIDHVEE